MGVYQVRTVINSPSSGGTALSTMHFEATTEDLLAVQGFVIAVDDFWADMVPFMKAGTTVQVQGEVVRVDATPETFVQTTQPSPKLGVNAQDALPWATQLVVSWRTATRARWAMGRTFIPCLTETFNTAGLPTAEITDALEAAATAFLAPYVSGPDYPVVWSRGRLVATQVTGFRVRDQWGTLRSRRD